MTAPPPTDPGIKPWPLPYVTRLESRAMDHVDLVVIHCTELPDLAMAREFGEREVHASRTGNSGHRSDEGRAEGCHRPCHLSRNRAIKRRMLASQRRKFRHQFRQQTLKPPDRPVITQRHCVRFTPALTDQINRPMVQMQPAIAKPLNLRPVHRCASGQPSSRAAVGYSPPSRIT